MNKKRLDSQVDVHYYKETRHAKGIRIVVSCSYVHLSYIITSSKHSQLQA